MRRIAHKITSPRSTKYKSHDMLRISWHWIQDIVFSVPLGTSYDILRRISWHLSHDIIALTFRYKLTFGKDEGK